MLFKRKEWVTLVTTDAFLELTNGLGLKRTVTGIIAIQEDKGNGKRRAIFKNLNRQYVLDYDYALHFIKEQGVTIPEGK